MATASNLLIILRCHGTSEAATWMKKNVGPILLKEIPTLIIKNITSAAAGSRIWPTDRRLDAKYGIRIDAGSMPYFDPDRGIYYRNFNLQINKNPDSAILKVLVAKNGTHDTRIIIRVPMNSDGTAVHESIQDPQDLTKQLEGLRGGV